MKNTVTFGLRNVHIAFLEDNVYAKPVPVPGAVTFTPSTAGDSSSFSADDNAKYYTSNTNAGYTAEVTQAHWPLEILAEMLGYEIDEQGGMLEVASAKAKPFALLFEVQGDKGAIRNVYYHCTASRPAQEYQTTTETTDIAGEQLSIIIAPYDVQGTGKLQVKYTLPKTDTNTTEFESFFSKVHGTKVVEDGE